MIITAQHTGKAHIELKHLASGQITCTDAPAAHGVLGQCPTPVDILAEALAACALTTAVMGATKQGIDTTGWHAEVEGWTKDQEANSVATIAIHFHFGAGVETKQRARLEAFTHRGCTVGNTLKCQEQFTFSYDA